MSESMTSRRGSNLFLALMSAAMTLGIVCPILAQNPSPDASAPHQMIVTRQGFIAIDNPKGWVQSDGPGLAFFLPKGVTADKADVWIYISSCPVGPNEEDKNMDSFIQSDIAGFKQRFKNGIIRKEETIALPEVKGEATVYTFQSGEANNAFEQVVYISDVNRVLVLDLSAKNSAAFTKSLPIFRDFTKSYRGSIQMGSPDQRPN